MNDLRNIIEGFMERMYTACSGIPYSLASKENKKSGKEIILVGAVFNDAVTPDYDNEEGILYSEFWKLFVIRK